MRFHLKYNYFIIICSRTQKFSLTTFCFDLALDKYSIYIFKEIKLIKTKIKWSISGIFTIFFFLNNQMNNQSSWPHRGHRVESCCAQLVHPTGLARLLTKSRRHQLLHFGVDASDPVQPHGIDACMRREQRPWSRILDWFVVVLKTPHLCSPPGRCTSAQS